MLCKDCIKALYCNLSQEAITIINTLTGCHNKSGLNQGQIIKFTGLSISVTRDALNELKGAMMVTATVKGRGIYYALSEGVMEAMGAEGLGTSPVASRETSPDTSLRAGEVAL